MEAGFVYPCVVTLPQLPCGTFCSKSESQRHCPGDKAVTGSEAPGRRVLGRTSHPQIVFKAGDRQIR